MIAQNIVLVRAVQQPVFAYQTEPHLHNINLRGCTVTLVFSWQRFCIAVWPDHVHQRQCATSALLQDFEAASLPGLVSMQDWMLERGAALRRPPAPAEDAEEDSPAVPSAPTFRLLDQGLPNMYLPNVAYTPTMVFFK